MHYGRYGYEMMGGGFNPLIGLIGFLIFIVVIAVIVFILVKLMKHKPHHGFMNNEPESFNMYAGKALEILNERYAKGEIDDEEYLKKKSELTKQ